MAAAAPVVQLVALCVGQPRSLGTPGSADPFDRPWESAFYKLPVNGPVFADRTNLAGDQQADLENHGGPDKAILAYAASHYAAWKLELGQAEMPWGAFGENFTLAGVTEGDCCLGDLWQAGQAVFEISQPRQPCWKLARRWHHKSLPALVIATGRTGWYLRVVKTGHVQAGDYWQLQHRPHPQWSVDRANRVMHYDDGGPSAIAELAQLAVLSASWRGALAAKLAD